MTDKNVLEARRDIIKDKLTQWVQDYFKRPTALLDEDECNGYMQPAEFSSFYKSFCDYNKSLWERVDINN